MAKRFVLRPRHAPEKDDLITAWRCGQRRARGGSGAFQRNGIIPITAHRTTAPNVRRTVRTHAGIPDVFASA
jgi:hypothetical protein